MSTEETDLNNEVAVNRGLAESLVLIFDMADACFERKKGHPIAVWSTPGAPTLDSLVERINNLHCKWGDPRLPDYELPKQEEIPDTRTSGGNPALRSKEGSGEVPAGQDEGGEGGGEGSG